MLSENRGQEFRRLWRVDRGRNQVVFEALKDTKFLLFHSEITARSEVEHSVLNRRKSSNSYWESTQLKDAVMWSHCFKSG